MLVEAEKSVLQAYSYFRDDSFVVGLCGFNITFTQIKIMLKELKVEEVIVGFDRDYEEADSFEATAYYQKIIKKVAPLVPYCRVYLVLDKKDRLGYKDSPTDKGKDTLTVYDYDLMIESLMKEDNMTQEEAADFISYNASYRQGDEYPIIINNLKRLEET